MAIIVQQRLLQCQPKAGVYVWCVKAKGTASNLSSIPCTLDTLTILDPYDVLDITKNTKQIKVNPNGNGYC